MRWLTSRPGRKWVYGVSLTVIPLLVAYGLIEESIAPLLVAMFGAIVAPSMALTHMTPTDQPAEIEIIQD